MAVVVELCAVRSVRFVALSLDDRGGGVAKPGLRLRDRQRAADTPVGAQNALRRAGILRKHGDRPGGSRRGEPEGLPERRGETGETREPCGGEDHARRVVREGTQGMDHERRAMAEGDEDGSVRPVDRRGETGE